MISDILKLACTLKILLISTDWVWLWFFNAFRQADVFHWEILHRVITYARWKYRIRRVERTRAVCSSRRVLHRKKREKSHCIFYSRVLLSARVTSNNIITHIYDVYAKISKPSRNFARRRRTRARTHYNNNIIWYIMFCRSWEKQNGH